MSQIFTVTQVNTQIKGLLESNPSFRNIFVQGEISNYKQHSSGHHYMTLKDEGGAISAVLFRSDALRLKFRPANGMQVIARGRISSFPKTGQVQLYMADMIPAGAGALHAAFEQLKARLAAEGLFDRAHKKPLPALPGTIAVITSPTGAAVRDMLRILGRRWPMAQVEIWPVRVQGEGAAAEIAQAIDRVSARGTADLIITGRGGGSIEDLWAFNEEIVARAIYRCAIPVISAVGHEPDVTIADYVADLRAPTPSGAAELAVPDQNEMRMQLDGMQTRLQTAWLQRLHLTKHRLQGLTARLQQQSPVRYLHDRRSRTAELTARLHRAIRMQLDGKQTRRDHLTSRLPVGLESTLSGCRTRLAANAAALDALSPLRVLTRGYAVVSDAAGGIVTDSAALQPGDRLQIRFDRGSASVRVEQIMEARKRQNGQKNDV